MTPQPHWRIFLSQIFGDRELYASLLVAAILLVGDMVAPVGWTPGFRIIALGILGLGLVFSVYNHYRTSVLLHEDKPLPIVIAIRASRRDALRNLELAKDAITQKTGFDAFRQVESFFNVHYEDLLVHRPEHLRPDPIIWRELLDETQRTISQFQQHLAGGCTYHVFFQGPSSLAFGLGALLGTKNRVVAYRHGEDKYQPALDLSQNMRRIKSYLPQQEPVYANVQFPPSLDAETAVTLDLASHTASGYVQSYLSKWEHRPPVVLVSNTYQGNLTEADWTPVAQEVYQVFLTLQKDPRVQHIHLFHSIPVPLALGLGMALGHFVPVTIYNWEVADETYYPVLQLNRLESLL